MVLTRTPDRTAYAARSWVTACRRAPSRSAERRNNPTPESNIRRSVDGRHMGHCLTRLRIVLCAALLLTFALTAVAVTAQAHAASPTQRVEEPGDDEAEPPDAEADLPGPDDKEPAPDRSDDPDWDPWPDSDSDVPPPLIATTQTVTGQVAALRPDGKAAIPLGAPRRVRTLIRQANKIIGKPYKLGGGHKKLRDRAYDCSGAVSFALVKSKLLKRVLVAGQFKRWGAPGAGRWISVYARRSHVYLEVAGLRLDTNSAGDLSKAKGVRWRPVIGKRSGFTARHRVGL